MKVWLLSWGGEGMPTLCAIFTNKPTFDQCLLALRGMEGWCSYSEHKFILKKDDFLDLDYADLNYEGIDLEHIEVIDNE